MKTLVLLTILLCSLLALPALAQGTNPKVTIELEDLTPAQVAQLMALKESAENGLPSGQTATEMAEEWAVFGERFGQVIASICKELGIAANEFIQTPVGKLAAIGIMWKILGEAWWGIIGGSLVWMIVTGLLWRSFSHFHMSKKVVIREGPWKWSKVKSVEFKRCYEFDDNNYQVGSVCAHAGFFALITVTCLVIVF